MSKFNILIFLKSFFFNLWRLNKYLVFRILYLLLVFQALRFLFFIFNYNLFLDVGFLNYCKIFLFGIRFDLVAILITNSLYIVLSLLPFSFIRNRYSTKILNTIFILTNSIAILFNLIDFGYFKISHKRISFDFIELVGDALNSNLMIGYLLNYWYLFILLLMFIFLIKNISDYKPTINDKNNSSSILLGLFNLIAVSSLVFVGARGGAQMRPITIANAAEYTNAKNIPLLLNSTFTLYNTITNSDLAQLKYFDDKKAAEIYSPIHFLNHNKPFKPLNVVLIILESFSKENVGYFNHNKTITPFLDSIMQNGTVFTNGFANATRSIEGIPAILASIPHLNNNAFITSPYSANQITSIANLLNSKGYNSTFYHGGRNGTMSFDAFTKLCGYQEYYGLNEYPNKNDFDGNWGIWDEPYLNYYCNELNNKKEPFFSTVFTLSSHDPYIVPVQYKNKFKEGKLPIVKAISYTDYALRKFFHSAKKTNWFANTLFVFTADHTSLTENASYSNSYGYHKIPIIFYQYNQEPKICNTITQQIDILPNIMEYLNYDQSYFSFGKSTINYTTNANLGVNFVDNTYQTFNDTQLIKFDTKKVIEVYNLSKDSLLQNNVISTTKENPYLNTYTKAYLQAYFQCLKGNKMNVESYFAK